MQDKGKCYTCMHCGEDACIGALGSGNAYNENHHHVKYTDPETGLIWVEDICDKWQEKEGL